jgi:hypothetical protein
VTYNSQALGESPVVALAPTESTEVVISLSQSVPYGRVEITANPDSNGSDEVTLLNNTAVVIRFAPADFEPNGDVDVNDLATLCQEWLSTTPPLTADIAPQPPDGIVNFLDFAQFAKYWLAGF